MGLNGILASGKRANITNWKDPTHVIAGKIHYFDWVIFNSYVCLKMLGTPFYPMVLLIIIPMKNGYVFWED